MYHHKPAAPANDFIFGIRAIAEAIQAGKEIDKVLFRKGLAGDLFKELQELIREHNIPAQQVPEEKLNRITRKNHQGVVAFLSPIVYQSIEQIVPTLFEQGRIPFILILDSLTDVRNIGAIARTAECAGVDAIIVPDKGSAQINADAVKTSAGALHHIPVCRVKSLFHTVKFLQESGLRIFAASEKADQIYYQHDYTVPLVLVMGSEDTGISPELIRSSDFLVRIPILGNIQSLNVSAATSVLVYEVIRQRA
jgi:23S rRNA (guanosine2251-2'-O)-methyltransferase